MRRARTSLCVMAVLAVVTTVTATQRLVPNPYPTIQDGIDAAQPGDTVSVWGPEGVPPPYTYTENPVCTDKNIVIVNRSFLPDGGTGYDSSWDHVIIDGSTQGRATFTVNRFASSGDVTIKGFTIASGNNAAGNGGGIDCQDANISIIKNNIHSNLARNGGGISIAGMGCSRATISDNRVAHNSAAANGGGMYLSSVSPVGTFEVRGNHVDTNSLTGPEASGGGIHTNAWPGPMRNNVICGNDAAGVHSVGNSNTVQLDLGTAGDPGLNVLMHSAHKELVMVSDADEDLTVGNCWGTLDANELVFKMLYQNLNPGAVLHIDPISASSRWFELANGRTWDCHDSVIFTGDFRISDGGILVLAPGTVMEFTLDPDTSLPNGDPERCDLFVTAPGSRLLAVGTPDDRIVFRSRRPPDPGKPGDWYGIRLDEAAVQGCVLERCEVRDACWGVDGKCSALEMRFSFVHGNEMGGVRSDRPGWLELFSNTICDNGECGVEVVMVNMGAGALLQGNRFWGNGAYGVHGVAGAQPHAPLLLNGNLVEPDQSAGAGTLVGLKLAGLTNTDGWVIGNVVAFCHQAGIEMLGSTVPLMSNHVFGTAYDGVRFSDGSSPLEVYGNHIDGCKSGVTCEGNSYPIWGTADNPGNNSILMGNEFWVSNVNPTSDPVIAECNWWGTDCPQWYPQKFIGPIDYDPWLLQPPPEGQQATASVPSVLTTALHECRPNPVRGRTTLHYELATTGPVGLSVRDAAGRVLKTLAREVGEPGHYSAVWDGTDAQGRLAPNGVYFYCLETPGFSGSKKLVVMR